MIAVSKDREYSHELMKVIAGAHRKGIGLGREKGENIGQRTCYIE